MWLKTTITFIYVLLSIDLFSQVNQYGETQKLFADKQYKQVIESCNKEIIKLKPQDTLYVKFIYLKIYSSIELKDFKQVIVDYNELIKIHPKDAVNYVGISYAYGEMGDFKSSITSLEVALKINPNDIYILNNLSYYNNQLGNFDQAINYSNVGLTKSPEPMWKGCFLSNRGYANISLKKYDIALKDINESIILYPDNSFAYCYRALANIGLNKTETVCNDLEKSKSLGAISLTGELIKKHCGQ